jgi:ATP-dependent RNA helicase RhlE
LLADIEKLIKHNIARIQLAGFVPSRSNERHERPGRSEDREGASRSRAPERSRSSYSPRKEKIDPWFLKPYEPETSATSPVDEDKQSPERSSSAKPQKKVAALLGGSPKR